MNYKALLLLFLSTTIIAKDPNLELELQKEKDYQEFRLKVIATIGTISLALIAAYVKIYLDRK